VSELNVQVHEAQVEVVCVQVIVQVHFYYLRVQQCLNLENPIPNWTKIARPMTQFMVAVDH